MYDLQRCRRNSSHFITKRPGALNNHKTISSQILYNVHVHVPALEWRCLILPLSPSNRSQLQAADGTKSKQTILTLLARGWLHELHVRACVGDKRVTRLRHFTYPRDTLWCESTVERCVHLDGCVS